MDENSGNEASSDNQALPGAVFSPNQGSPTVQAEQSQPAPGAPSLPNPQVGAPQPQQDIHINGSAQPVVQGAGQPNSQLVDNGDGMSWIGPEFVSHDQSSNLYIICVVVALVLGGITYLLTRRDLVSSLTIALAIITLGFYSLRKPKDIGVTLNSSGLILGDKTVVYEELRAFTATVEGDFLSVTLLPLKRFGPPLGFCYRGADEAVIVNFLAERLPMEKHSPDMLEKFLLRIRF